MLLVACLVAAACSASPSSGGTPGGANAAGGGAVGSGAGLCPLTGLPAPGLSPMRPALAAKIENSAAARPQAGLEAADVVYEVPVEGGLAWLLAVFHCSDPVLVGPVRAAHLADAEILMQYRPVIFAFAGGHPQALEKIRATEGIGPVDGRVSGTGFQRERGRRMPHNLFASPEKLRTIPAPHGAPAPLGFRPPGGAPARGGTASASPSRDVATGPAGRPTGDATRPSQPKRRPGSSVTLSPGGETVRYVYDPGRGAYLRFHGDTPHRTQSGEQLAATNLLVLWTEIRPSAIRDEAGNPSPEIVQTGRGEALVLQEGRETEASWVRQGPSERLRLVDRPGKPIELVPGTTWIHLLPKDRPAYVR